MKFKNILMAATVGLILSACNNGGGGGGKSVSTPPPPKKVIDMEVSALAMNTDPTCGMPLKKGGIEDTAIYEGKVYGFCNTGCKTEFLQNPAEALKKK